MREIVITPGRTRLQLWSELWDYRELFWLLSWRDVAVRYKQTVIGVAWSVLRPLLTMAIFTLVFGRLAHLPAEGVPYALFVLAAMVPWQLFATALSEGSASLLNNSSLLTKVYFPRVLIPASVLLVGLLDAAIALVMLFVLAAFYGYWPDPHLLALPFFVALGLCASFGCAVWLAALNARYRDFRYVVPFLVQVGLYVSPVGFSATILPENWRLVAALNPMMGVIDGFRWSLFRGETTLDPRVVAISLLVTAVLVVLGARSFRATERVLADVL